MEDNSQASAADGQDLKGSNGSGPPLSAPIDLPTPGNLPPPDPLPPSHDQAQFQSSRTDPPTLDRSGRSQRFWFWLLYPTFIVGIGLVFWATIWRSMTHTYMDEGHYSSGALVILVGAIGGLACYPMAKREKAARKREAERGYCTQGPVSRWWDRTIRKNTGPKKETAYTTNRPYLNRQLWVLNPRTGKVIRPPTNQKTESSPNQDQQMHGQGATNTVIAAADWYPDPTGAATYRYWDGASWTEHISP